jgi:hypothetical protein
VGQYSNKWWGWVALLDPCPLIRGDIRFSGWAQIEAAELEQIRQRSLIGPELKAQRRNFVVVPATSIESRAVKIEAAVVVTARKPRRR